MKSLIVPCKSINGCLLFFLLLSFLLAATSCKTRKSKKTPSALIESEEVLLRKLKDNAFDFNTFEARASIKAQFEGRQHSFNANIRMKKDSIIWISVSPFLGIELFRVVITTDSVKAINRLENVYYDAGISYLSTLLRTKLDFDLLQAVLTGNDIEHYAHGTISTATDGAYARIDMKNRTSPQGVISNLQHTILLNSENGKIVKHTMRDTKENYIFEAAYSDFKTENGYLFPTTSIIKANTGKETLDMSISFSRININKSLTYPFSVPENYKKMP